MSEKKQIKFEEIQDGDVLEVVDTYASGLKIKREGVAANLVESPARMVWYHKGTHRQQVLVEYGTRSEIWLLERVEKKDHLVVWQEDGRIEAYTCVGRTKTEAEEIAAKYNAKDIAGRIFRAVKVG